MAGADRLDPQAACARLRVTSSTTSASLRGVATRASFADSVPAQLDQSTLRTTRRVTPPSLSAKTLPFPTIGRGPSDDPVASVAADERELREALGQLPRLGVPEPYPITQ